MANFKKIKLSILLMLGCYQIVFASDSDIDNGGVEETKGFDIVDVNIGGIKIAAERGTINKLANLKSVLGKSLDKKQLVLPKIESVSDFERKVSMLLFVLHHERFDEFSWGYLEEVFPLAIELGLDSEIAERLELAIALKKSLDGDLRLEQEQLQQELKFKQELADEIGQVQAKIKKEGFSALSVVQNLLVDEIVFQWLENGRKFVELSLDEEHLLPLEVLKILHDRGCLERSVVMRALIAQAAVDDSMACVGDDKVSESEDEDIDNLDFSEWDVELDFGYEEVD